MALGQVIVRQLELEDRGTVLERWLAHHLAEVIAEADQAAGTAKAASESRAVDLVLKLWAHRRALPEPADPLGGYRQAVQVLGRLTPEANPWARFRQPDGYDDMLHEMFRLLSRIVLAGLALTQFSRGRPITAEESLGLEDEENYVQSVFEQWMPFFPRPRTESAIDPEFTDAGTAEAAGTDEKSERPDDSGGQEHMSDEQQALTDAQLHALIAADLERVQVDLAKLLTRWRESPPHGREGASEHSPSLAEDHAATEYDPAGAVESGDMESEKTGAVANGTETTTPPDRDHSFWSSLSLDELAEGQGVTPVEDLESISALWPSDDEPDELLAHVLAERAARRQAGSNPGR